MTHFSAGEVPNNDARLMTDVFVWLWFSCAIVYCEPQFQGHIFFHFSSMINFQLFKHYHDWKSWWCSFCSLGKFTRGWKVTGWSKGTLRQRDWHPIGKGRTHNLEGGSAYDSHREVEIELSAVFSVQLEGMCTIFNWGREKCFVLGCTVAFMNLQLLQDLDSFLTHGWICIQCEYADTKHREIEHITFACSTISFKCLCVFGDANILVYY